jgi:hypothetical protein
MGYNNKRLIYISCVLRPCAFLFIIRFIPASLRPASRLFSFYCYVVRPATCRHLPRVSSLHKKNPCTEAGAKFREGARYCWLCHPPLAGGISRHICESVASIILNLQFGNSCRHSSKLSLASCSSSCLDSSDQPLSVYTYKTHPILLILIHVS